MNRHAEMPREEPDLKPEIKANNVEIEESFFRGGGMSLAELEEAHPLGPEADPEEERRADKEKAKGLFDRLRKHPLTRPLFFAMALMVGAETVGTFRQSREGAGSDPEVQVSLEDPGVQQEFERLVFSELRESGLVMTESEGRYGMESWSTGEVIEYDDIPTLEGKFEYLHKDNPEIIKAYRDPKGRVESFAALFGLMGNEFRHSRLPFDFVEQTVGDAAAVLPELPPAEAYKIYSSYEETLIQVGGLKWVRALAGQLKDVIPIDHPIAVHIDEKLWLADEAQEWFKPSKDNFMLFNQNRGRVEVYHQVGNNVVLLEAFPGNGGPPNGAAWERGMPAHIAVRTPDGEYMFDQAFEKKSASWRNSWVTDTAALRWAEGGKEVEYQDTDGTWRRLTGEDAEFVVNGAAQKPFRDKGKSTLYQWTSQRQEDGSWERPEPFSVDEALGSGGQLRETWDRNDFGPKSIQIKDTKGKQMSIFFHSSPTDEKPIQFLDYSHGCIHMKPADLDAAADYLVKGSRIRISAFETQSKIAQLEKPGTSSEPTGG